MAAAGEKQMAVDTVRSRFRVRAARVTRSRRARRTFAELGRGEAIIYTTLGPDPRRTSIVPVEFEPTKPERVSAGLRHACELSVHPEKRLPAAAGAGAGGGDVGPDPHAADF